MKLPKLDDHAGYREAKANLVVLQQRLSEIEAELNRPVKHRTADDVFALVKGAERILKEPAEGGPEPITPGERHKLLVERKSVRRAIALQRQILDTLKNEADRQACAAVRDAYAGIVRDIAAELPKVAELMAREHDLRQALVSRGIAVGSYLPAASIPISVYELSKDDNASAFSRFLRDARKHDYL